MNRSLIAGAVVCAGLAGCSTARNLFYSDVHDTPPWEVYGGVTAAVKNVYTGTKPGSQGMALMWPFVAVDVTASAVADTFTLPFTGTVWMCDFVRHVYDYYWPPDPKPTVQQVIVPEAKPASTASTK